MGGRRGPVRCLGTSDGDGCNASVISPNNCNIFFPKQPHSNRKSSGIIFIQRNNSFRMSKPEKKLQAYLEFCPHKKTATCIGMGRKDHLFATGGKDNKTLVWTIHHLRKTGKPFKVSISLSLLYPSMLT